MATVERHRSRSSVLIGSVKQASYTTLIRLLPILLTTILLDGCVGRAVTLKSVQDARNYQDLIDVCGRLDCKQAEIFQECLCHTRSFSIVSLKSRSQVFRFWLDGHDHIVDRYLYETSTTYHLLPRFRLPPALDDFR